MSDLNEEILRLKVEGLSLRGIATALGISHEAVRKRLRAVKDKDQVSTKETPSPHKTPLPKVSTLLETTPEALYWV